MRLQPVPHSLSRSLLSGPGQPCDNTVNNSNVWCERATGAATVGASKARSRAFNIWWRRTRSTPASLNATTRSPAVSLFSPLHTAVHSWVLNPFPCALMLTAQGEEKKKKKEWGVGGRDLNKLRRPARGPVSLSPLMPRGKHRCYFRNHTVKD